MQKTLYTGSSKKEVVIHVYVDGGTRGNQICLIDGRRKILKTRRGKLTNNELEYLAVIYGLQYIINHYQNRVVHLYSDSKLIVQQVNGHWKVTTQSLFLLHLKADRLLEKSGVILKWTPRDFNLAGIYLEELWDK